MDKEKKKKKRKKERGRRVSRNGWKNEKVRDMGLDQILWAEGGKHY